ncbi:BamA/TamA family outer membrane protein [bacterium]|nr:BamA/TamA family outer membrane protein [bacterium]
MNKRCILARFIFFVLIAMFFVVSSENKSSTFSIKQIVPKSFILTNLIIESDVNCSEKEILYLLGANPGDVVTQDLLQIFVANLKKKGEFEDIQLSYKKSEDGFDVTVCLFGCWNLDKIKFHGLVVGKEQYRQYYLIHPGKIFDIEMHKRSLEKIQEALFGEGFFNANTFDYLEHDRPKKTVIVNIVINQGNKFFVDSCSLDVKSEENLPSDEMEKIKKKLDQFVRKEFVGKLCSSDIVNSCTKNIKTYLAQKGFLSLGIVLKKVIEGENETVKLLFSVEISKKKIFVFFGNHFFSKEFLLDRVLLFGKSSWSLPASVFVDDVVQLYKNNGFWDVRVETKEEENKFFFIIDEGKRASIKEIVVDGFENCQNEVDKYFQRLIRSKFYNYDLLKECIDDFVDFYLKSGFLDFKILKQRFDKIQEREYRLIFFVDKGSRRFVRSVKIEPLKELEKEEVFCSIRNVEFVPFDLDMIQEQRKWLTIYLQKKGYLYSRVKPEFDVMGKYVDITWNISGVGRPVFFGKTICVGNTKLPIDKVLRELEYKEGDIWSKEKLERSLFHLRDLKIFESVQLYPYKVAVQESKKDIILRLVEDDPFEIKARVGFQQVSKHLKLQKGSSYKVGGSFFFKNPFNNAGFAGADIDCTRFYKELRGYYQTPWLFGRRIKTLFKGYSIKYEQPPFLGSEKTLYEAIQQGFLVGFTHKKNKCVGGVNIGIESMETSNVSNDIAQAINFSSQLVDKKIPYFFLEPNILFDFLDDNVNPTKGAFTLVSLKGMFPLNDQDVFFIKLLAEQSLFVSFNTPFVFALRFRFGHIFNKLFSGIMPPERFYLGGAYSLRSYETDMAPPLGSFVENDITRYVPRGGRTMFNLNFEVRIPLWFKKLGLVVFQDFGLLAGDDIATVKGGDILAGTGFGLRYFTPIGPLRFDIGWKWKKQYDNESSFAWFLTLGHAF